MALEAFCAQGKQGALAWRGGPGGLMGEKEWLPWLTPEPCLALLSSLLSSLSCCLFMLK